MISRDLPRQQWMDLVRGVCILLVITVHISGIIDSRELQVPALLQGANAFLDPFRIPLLMLLSGMLLHKALAKPPAVFIWRKFCLIFWPFLIWSVAVYWAEDRLTLENLLKTPLTAPSVLWYLWFLFAYYIGALVLVRYKISLPLVIAVCLLMSAFLPSIARADRFAVLFAFFLGGHWLVESNISLSGRRTLALCGAALAVTGGVISSIKGTGSIKYELLFIWAPIGLAAFIGWAKDYYRPNGATSLVEWIGRQSIVFYAIHFPIGLVTVDVLSERLGLGAIEVFSITVMLIVVAGIAVQSLRSRLSAINWLFDFREYNRLLNVRG